MSGTETLTGLLARLDRARVVSARLDALNLGNDPEASGFLLGYLTSANPDAVAAALDALDRERAEEADPDGRRAAR